MNQITIVGNSGSKPELRFTQNQMAVLSPSLAVSKSYKDANGNWVKQSFWVTCTFWGKLAERAAQEIEKGSRVMVTGELAIRDYTGRDGQKKQVTEIVVRDYLCAPKRAPQSDLKEVPHWEPQATSIQSDLTDDDIPF